jgi:predicted lipid-binding transport protein (Tim44 family)
VERDRAGGIVSGNPDRVKETIDVWTFGRNTQSKDPTWLLYATREENAGAMPVPSVSTL